MTVVHDSSDLVPHEAVEDETLWERRWAFLSQRAAGGTFRAIANRYNERNEAAGIAKRISAATVRKDVEAAKREAVEAATRESLIGEHRGILLDMRRANYAAMVGGDVDAAKIVMSTLVRESEMFGLDAPKRSVVGVGTDVEFASTLLSLIESIGGDVPKELADVARVESDDRRRDILDVQVVDDEPDLEVDGQPWSNVGHGTE